MSAAEGLELELEQFARKVGLIVALEIGGKSSPDVAFQEIKTLYKKLKKFRKETLIQDVEGLAGDSSVNLQSDLDWEKERLKRQF